MFMYLYICFPFRNIYIYNYQGINSKLSIAAIYILSHISSTVVLVDSLGVSV